MRTAEQSSESTVEESKRQDRRERKGRGLMLNGRQLGSEGWSIVGKINTRELERGTDYK